MIKAMVFIARKPGISREAFIAHYETQHAPLARRCFPQIRTYRRNYVVTDSAILFEAATLPDFDVVTEITYASEEDYQAMLRRAAEPEISEMIAADEARFMNRSTMRFMRVDVEETPDIEG